jgi:hypothetical protein
MDTSMGISKNFNRKLLNLCMWRKKTVVPSTCEAIKYKARELAKSHNIAWHQIMPAQFGVYM